MPSLRRSLLLLLSLAAVSLPAFGGEIGPFTGPEADAEAARLYERGNAFVNNVTEGLYSYAYIQFHWKRASANLDRIARAYPSSPTAAQLQAGQTDGQIDIVAVGGQRGLQHPFRQGEAFARHLRDGGGRLFDHRLRLARRGGRAAVRRAAVGQRVEALRQRIADRRRHPRLQGGGIAVGRDRNLRAPHHFLRRRPRQARLHVPAVGAFEQVGADQIVRLRYARLRRHDADVFDLRQPAGQAHADRLGHGRRGGVGVCGRDRHDRHGRFARPARRAETVQDDGGRDDEAEDRRGQRRHRHGTAPETGGRRRCLRWRWHGRWRRYFRRDPGGRVLRRDLDGEQVATAGHAPDQFAPFVAQRGANLTDALEQAVVADMDVRPDGVHQLLLGDHPSGIGGQKAEHLQGLGPQPQRLSGGRAQFGARLVQLEPRKAPHRPRIVP